MAESDRNPARDSGDGEVSFLPDRPVWLALLLLLLAAAGVTISWLFGSLGAALGACFLALWAAAAVAVAAALIKRIRTLRARRHQKESGPLPPAQNNLEQIPKAEGQVAEPKRERAQRSQKWVVTFERIVDEKKDLLQLAGRHSRTPCTPGNAVRTEISRTDVLFADVHTLAR